MESTDIGDNKFNLRWPNYHDTILSTFRSLKAEEDFVDVTLSCEEEQYSAHKVVLSACSPYFRKLLKNNPCQHPIVILRDVKEEDLRCLLNFMYHGEVQVQEDKLQSFLKTAETLQVRGLVDHPLQQCQKTSTSLSPLHIPDHGEVSPPHHNSRDDGDRSVSAMEDDYSPLLKRSRLLTRSDSSPTSPSSSSHHHGHQSRHHNGDNESGVGGLAFNSSTTAASSTTSTTSWLRTARIAGSRRDSNDMHHNSLSGDKTRDDKLGGHDLTATGESERTVSLKSSASLLSQALEKSGNMMDDSASDTTLSERPGSVNNNLSSVDDRKSSVLGRLDRDLILGGGDRDRDLRLDDHGSGAGAPPPLFPPGLEALYRQAGFPPFLGLGGAGNGGGADSPAGMARHLPGPSTTHIGLQSHAANPTIGGKLEMIRVRATDPRPCPKCGKIYRSAHTLRTHMEDKHTICPGYRCVLCGTVAKSRNSLHSHMSRQHRGISTKDLPVVPMPAPFDPELASKLLSKAGVKVSPSELAARASPTAPRRSDLPKLDNSLSMHQQNQFPLPPSLPPTSHHLAASLAASRELHHGGDPPEDLRLSAASTPFSSSAVSPHTSSAGGLPANFPALSHLRAAAAAGGNHKDFAAGLVAAGAGAGSALLDTYLAMISAADNGNMAAAAAALNFQNTPAARAAAMAAAAAAAAGMLPMNGKAGRGGIGDDRYGSDREEEDDEEGELGSDAENDDISEAGDEPQDVSSPPLSTSMASPLPPTNLSAMNMTTTAVNNSDH